MDEVKIILPPGGNGKLHILAAVSGGADSVALLALLRDAVRTQSIALTAAHFEHGIRAEESLADAAFVRDLCAGWDIPLIEGQADVPALAKARSVGLEEAARNARYEFLHEARAQVGADYIALAHHRDDQVETVMMHLLRGSGLHGMTGMKEVDGVLYRPLLQIPKETLVCYLMDWGIPWREDATNREADNPRNALRLNVLPEIDRIYPGAREAVCRFARMAAEEDGYMERAAQAYLERHAVGLPSGWLIELSHSEERWADEKPLLMRAMHRITNLEYEAVRRVVSLWEKPTGQRSVSLEKGWNAERGRRGIYLLRRDYVEPDELPLQDSGSMELPCGLGVLTISSGTGVPVQNDPFCQELDAAALEGAVIRTRRDGDFIHPLGAPGRQKLSDYFINRHVDRPLRDIVPLLAKGNEVYWVMGEGISEKAKLKEGIRAIRLRLTDSPLQKLGGKSNA